jgi:hypothetical protein
MTPRPQPTEHHDAGQSWSGYERASRLWRARILHALDPHRGGYTANQLDRLRIMARGNGADYMTDKEAAELVSEGEPNV